MMNEKRVMRMEQIKEWAEEWGLQEQVIFR